MLSGGGDKNVVDHSPLRRSGAAQAKRRTMRGWNGVLGAVGDDLGKKSKASVCYKDRALLPGLAVVEAVASINRYGFFKVY